MQNNHRNLSRQITQLQDKFVLVHLTEGITNNRPGTICSRLGCINIGLSETAPLRLPLPLSRLDLNGMPSK